jgi:hypothetical protein
MLTSEGEILPFKLIDHIQNRNRFDIDSLVFTYPMKKGYWFLKRQIRRYRATVQYDLNGAPLPEFFIKISFGKQCDSCSHWDYGIEVLSHRSFKIIGPIKNSGYLW